MAVEIEFIKYLTDGVLVLNEGNTIVDVNPALERLLEDTAGQLIGKTPTQIINCRSLDSDSSACHPLCPLLTLRDKLKGEPLSFVTRNGLRREALATLTTTPAGYGLLILQDISVAKRQERLQTEFIATASHQLRTPLASIKTSISLLLENTNHDYNPLLRRLMQNIEVSSLRLERVVNDLIELTNLLSGRVKLQPGLVEVSSLIESTLLEVRPWLEGRRQKLQLSLPTAPLSVVADPTRISQVLGHLISNASKFSPDDSEIQLVVQVAEKAASGGPTQVVFKVVDEGIGIEPAERDLVFEKFYQVQTIENVKAQGSGLGLPLAKVLVELSGGHIWFESQPGQGSAFSFSLPMA